MNNSTRHGSIYTGVSGWRYEGWRGGFYPDGLRQIDELAFASRAMRSIEINGTHYSLQSPKSFHSWYAQTPEAFVFSVKSPRYLTHTLRLREDGTAVAMANFFAQGLLALREKLGPILWQFPPSFRFEPERMEAFLALLPHDTVSAAALAEKHDKHVRDVYLDVDRNRRLRHAVEIRHESFEDPAFIRLLRRYKAAIVVSDAPEKWPVAHDLTAGFVYMRLHGTQAKYAGAYGNKALDAWAARIARWARGEQIEDACLIAPDVAPPARKTRDVFCYFDNDIKAQAPFDARSLAQKLGIDEGLTKLGRRPPGP